MLRKGVYPYEYRDDWKKFNEISKEDLYSHLNMEYARHKRCRLQTCKKTLKKKLGEYDLHVQSNTLLLADVFENFRNMCLEIYELDPAKFLLVPGLVW